MTAKCPDSGLILPKKFIDQRRALTNVINELVEKAVNSMGKETRNYFLTFSARFGKFNPEEFEINAPMVTFSLPPFKTNTIIYWVSPRRGIKEILWMVPPGNRGQKIQVEFNKEGVAYLQAKGAMPSQPGKAE